MFFLSPALGADRLTATRPAWLRRLAVWCGLLFVSSAIVFSNGVFIARHWLDEANANSPVWKNIYGVVYYAAGWRDRAREMFESGLFVNWHLSNENLAAMALEEGRPLEALFQMRSATKFQPNQSFGMPADKITYNRTTQAEYFNTLAVIYDRLGWKDQALDAAREAVKLDPSIPEANYDLAVLTLASAIRSDGTRDETRLAEAAAEAHKLVWAAALADPGFTEVHVLAGSILVLEGNCDEGYRLQREALEPHPGRYRFYPVSTGVGDIQAAAIRRRMHIATLPEALQPTSRPAWCTTTN